MNPRQAEWPQADFIVGNPPFIGKLKMREALGDGYVTALRKTYESVPDSADLVMYWWHKSAEAAAAGACTKFGLITTNSLTMTYNRRVVDHHLTAKTPIHLEFAIPDHPWVDNAQGAAVRIAMTVGAPGSGQGNLQTVVSEGATDADARSVEFSSRHGLIHANLAIGANVAESSRLLANSRISAMGMILVGAGFIVEPGDPLLTQEPERIRPYLNGKDLTQRSRGVHVIDLYGLTAEEVRQRYPACFQRLYERVKPERDVSNDKSLRENWWLFRRTNIQLRDAIANLPRFIGTTETAKHRLFSFIPGTVTPDQKIRVIGSDNAYLLACLSSSIHVIWSLATGGTLEDRPVYNNTTCFETFPFPSDDTGLTPDITNRISQLAEELDAFRKARQAAHESVTLTGMYNVLDKLRREEPLNAKDKALHEQALVGVLRTLHDELDAAVLDAYGWQDLGPVPWTDEEARQTWTERLLEHLVDLNTRRAAEEARGTIRWLRPEFQNPTAPTAAPQSAIELVGGAPAPEADAEDEAQATAAAPTTRQPWPADLPGQMRAVADALAASAQSLDEGALAARFTGRGPWKKRLPQILETLVVLGKAQRDGGGRWRRA